MRILLLGLFAILLQACEGVKSDDGKALEEAFLNPPESSKPWVYWYWISDNISKEGITKDLEAMAEVGIGEALIGNILDSGAPKGAVPVLTEQWWEMVEHAIGEAERIGIKVGMFNCPGWSQSGGPWVKPSQAMRYLVTQEYRAAGGKMVKHKFTAPGDHYQMVMVQAFPAPKGEDLKISSVKHSVSSSDIKGASALTDGNEKSFATFTTYPTVIEFKTAEPFTVRSLEMLPVDLPMSAEYILEATKDGKWIKVAEGLVNRYNLAVNVGAMQFAPICIAFEAITATDFRLTFKGEEHSAKGRMSEIALLSAPRLASYPEKQLAKMDPSPLIVADSYLWDPSLEIDDKEMVVDPNKIIDLAAMIDNEGNFAWQAPEGDWIIIRSGMLPTGTKNAPTTLEGEGYEIDKMNKELASFHFDAYIGKVLERIPAAERSGFRHIVADSYEQGSQNWTDGFAEYFESVYGYSPYRFFPVLTGRIVESSDASDRFLWDMRRAVADRISSDYVGGMRQKCEDNGLRLWLEDYGHWGYPGEFLSYGGASDDVGGEFWFPNNGLGAVECRCASSAGHTYGMNTISAEAFTSGESFTYTPRDFKSRGDWSWSEGINHFVLHLYIHQPTDQKPGVSAWFGTDFNRNSTWFFDSKPYFDYLRRSSALLQQGSHVADVAYFISEDTPSMTGDKTPALPIGYDYDFINAEILKSDAKVKDGRIVLSSGANYAILVLPPRKTMRPEMIAAIEQLVKDGATILGDKPLRSPSYKGYPKSDTSVKEIADKLWSKETYGKGRVFSGITLEQAFEKMGIDPDIEMEDGLLYTHRRRGDADIYFISNQKDANYKGEFKFRVSGKQPELWDAVSGEMRKLPKYTISGGITTVELEFAPSDSWFIVFRDKAEKGLKGENFSNPSSIADINGAWNVSFDEKMGAPKNILFNELIDLTSSDNNNIKYYSGTATYNKEFTFGKKEADKRYFINLGEVNAFATVKVNGTDLGTLWRYPYRIDVTDIIIQGTNTLEVSVTNQWFNRLIGDKQKGATKYAIATHSGGDATSELKPSGLKGPVTIEHNAQ